MSAGKIVAAVLAGVAVGAALGILFAPEKGSETRRRIAKKGKDYADELGEKANEFIDGITEKYENVITLVGFKRSINLHMIMAPMTPPNGNNVDMRLNCCKSKPTVFKMVGIQLVKR